VRRMCRNILNTCIRNTEEAEKSSQSTASTPTSGRGQGKGLWGLIEESELARSIRKDDSKKVELHASSATPPASMLTSEATPVQAVKDTVSEARLLQCELEKFVTRSPSSSSGPAQSLARSDPDLLARTRNIMRPLADVIGSETDPAHLEELLVLNDALTSLLTQASPRPHLSLQGLGFNLNQAMSSPIIMSGANGEMLGIGANGHALPVAEDRKDESEEFDEALLTPRIDKGKGRAPPAPEVHEQVLSPEIMSPSFSFINRGDEDEDEDGLLDGIEGDLQEPGATDR
jgi:protein phosphatase 1 regulatory subunit 37